MTRSRRVRAASCVYLVAFTIALALIASPATAGQYKRLHRSIITELVNGRTEPAIARLEKHLAEHPQDLETHYCLAVAYAQLGDSRRANRHVQQAMDNGLPFSRFIAGPRDLLAPLTSSKEFKARARQHPVALLHGPLLGSVTSTRARIWVRTARESDVQIVASISRDFKDPIISAVVRTSRSNDLTAVVQVSGLQPNTRYHYRIFLNEREVGRGLRMSFRTYPSPGTGGIYRVGFGGGGGYVPEHERMWDTLADRRLHAFIALGDNVYIDSPKVAATQRYCYYRRQSRPEWRRLTASTPVFAVWDDHDFGTNDSYGGPDKNRPAWKLPVWRIFKENWANPYYGGSDGRPGVWHSFSIGDVEFFLLDSRFYRTDAGKKRGTMLGPDQKRWLLGKLKTSTATFKIIASPVPWAAGAKGGTQMTPDGPQAGGQDTWDGFPREREEIFSFIEKNRIAGVFLISADRHRSDAWRTNRPAGYPLYEASSSRLTNTHTHSEMPGSLFYYNDKNSFGLLDFDTTRENPELAYHVVNIDNRIVRTLKLKLTELSF